jgi:hypothetical protein
MNKRSSVKSKANAGKVTVTANINDLTAMVHAMEADTS